jgi:hypothetical protein
MTIRNVSSQDQTAWNAQDTQTDTANLGSDNSVVTEPVEDTRPPDPAMPSDAQLAAPAMKAKVNAANGASSPDATTQTRTGEPLPYLTSDPRFADLQAKLEAGEGAAAMEAANKLITALTAEKPQNKQLLNEARMGAAAAAMMNGKLDDAKKALLAVSPKNLGADEKRQYDDLCNLLKEGYRSQYSQSIQADLAPGSEVQDRGKEAADQARSLLDLLQKTDPKNSAAMDETRLKLSGALLLGGHYQEAEKALNGIKPERLSPDQSKCLQALQKEIHAQQIVALGVAYGSDIKRGRYAQAVQNATAVVNDLSKYFPDEKTKIMAARLDQAKAQLSSGDLPGARKSLSRVTTDEFKAAPPEVQQYYSKLKNQIDQAAKDKAEQADIHHQLDTIHRLTAYGDKDAKNDAQAMAAKLLADVERNHPLDTKKIEAMKLTVANIAVEAGDTAGATSLAKEIAANTQDPDTRDQAHLTEANAALASKPPQLNQAVQILRSLAQSGSSAEARNEAKQRLISIESDHFDSIAEKADGELKSLQALKKKNIDDLFNEHPQPKEVTVMGMKQVVYPDYVHDLQARGLQQQELERIAEPHKEATDVLNDISKGAKLAVTVMKTNGLTAADLEGMDYKKLATLPGVGSEADAKMLRRVLNMQDASTIAKGDLQGHQFSWDKKSLYVDPSYLDTPRQRAIKWIGEQVRTARAQDEVMRQSDSWVQQGIGWASAHVLDGISATNSFVKEKIDTAYDYYQSKGGVLGKIGMAATFVADQGAQLVTMPATIVDYKATDEQRGAAIDGALLMLVTAPLFAEGGAALMDAGRGIVESEAARAVAAAAKRLASSPLGTRVAESWVGKAARWTANAAESFPNSRMATTIDKALDAAGRINRFHRPTVPASIEARTAAARDAADLRAIATGRGSVDQRAVATRKDAVGDTAGSAQPATVAAGQGGGGMGSNGTTGAGVPRVGVSEGAGGDGAQTAAAGQRGGATVGPDAQQAPDVRRVAAGEASSETGAAETAEAHTPDRAAAPDAPRTDDRLKDPEEIGAADTLELPAIEEIDEDDAVHTPHEAPDLPGRNLADVVNSAVGDRTPAEIRQSITAGEIKGVENSVIREDYEKMVAAKKEQRPQSTDRDVKGEIEEDFAFARRLYGQKGLRETLRESMRDQYSENDIREIALTRRIYKEGYHGTVEDKAATISQESYDRALAASKGRPIGADSLAPGEEPTYWQSPDGRSVVTEDSYWHHRSSMNGLDGRSSDIRRIYFNVKPDYAADLANELSKKLSAAQVDWQYKMPKDLTAFDRPDSGVLYVGKQDYQKVKRIVMDYAQKHPEAFADGTPALTKTISRGIGVAEEPRQPPAVAETQPGAERPAQPTATGSQPEQLPRTPGGTYSFGSSRSRIIAEAIMSAPDNATKEEILAIVRQRMQAYGLDPHRPWLSRAGEVDDL